MIFHVRPAQLQAWFAQVAASSNSGNSSSGAASGAAPLTLPIPLVLDVREPWELQTASIHAQGFETLAVPMRSIPEQVAALDRQRPIACLCHHGMRSQQVAAFLEHHGFEHVANITGGINAWSLELDASVPQY